MSNELTEHGRKALERCIRELGKFIELADDYDLDEMSVQALQPGIESMQMRLECQRNPAAGPSEHDESWAEMMEHDYDTAARGPVISKPVGAMAYCRELSEIHARVLTEADNMLALGIKAAKATHPQPVTPAGGEVWVPVVGFEGLYEVSDAGQVRSLKTGELLSDRNRMGAGYVKVTLWKDGEKTQTSMHRVVASAFPVDGEGDEVNHKNGIKTDNRADNLEWVTRAGNEQHSRYVLGHLCQPIIAVNLDSKEIRRFPSQAKAAEELGLPYDRIRQCLTGYRETAKGWQFFREGQIDHPPVADAALDRARLDYLDSMVEAYGFENEHLGNRWTIEGPFRTLRDAIDCDRDAALNQRGGGDHG